MSKNSVRCVLVDLSGTIHIDDTEIPGSLDALERLRKSDVNIKFVTNTTKESKRVLHERLCQLGFTIAAEEIFTSLTAARKLIEQKNVRPLLMVDDKALDDFEGIPRENPNAVVVGLAPDKFDYNTMNAAFRNSTYSVSPWVERRTQHGAYHALMQEMMAEDTDSYTHFVRMDPASFHRLLELVEPLLQKQETVMRQSISAAERLALTLRFLASGDSYQSLRFLFRIGRTTLGEIIPEVCRALVTALKDDYLKVPKTTQEWEEVASAFKDRWDFPHCICAMDGKHIAIQAPPNSGSMYYNYKEFHSIVFLAVVDANYRIIWYDLGSNGKNNDAGIYSCSTLSQALEENVLNVLTPRPIPSSRTEFPFPFVLVGDDAFPLKTHLMKPFPHSGLSDKQKVFNYRLSLARRVSENAFGIIINRFRVLEKKMRLQPTTASSVTEACLVLLNYLRTN